MQNIKELCVGSLLIKVCMEYAAYKDGYCPIGLESCREYTENDADWENC